MPVAESVTERLILRPLGLRDCTQIQAAASRREVSDTMISIPHPFSAGEAERYVRTRLGLMRIGTSRTMIFSGGQSDDEDNCSFRCKNFIQVRLRGYYPDAATFDWMREVDKEQLDSTVSQLGLLLGYDSRDNIFSPNGGIKADFEAMFAEKAIGSEHTKTTIGGGFRYLIARRLGLRAGIDVARGPEEWGFYFQFGNAWPM